MATAQGIRAGRAFVELFADDSKLVRGLRAAERKLKAFGDGVRNLGLKMVGVGSAILAPLAGAAKSFADMGSRMWDMAKRTGVSVEALSALGYAAEQSGAGMEAFENGIRRMQRTIYDAGRGLSTATDALADLGLTTQDMEGLSPEAQFRLLADRLDKIEDPSRKAAIAMTIFGRSGTQLLPMLEGGAAALDAYEQHARKLGLVMSTEDAAAADAFGDALDDLWKTLKMSVFTIGSALAPTLKMVAEKITYVVTVVSAWIKQNQQIVVTVLRVAAVVVAVGFALAVLGTIISGLGTILGVLITVVTTVVAVLKVLAAVIAFLISPIGLVIAAVAALGAYLVYATDIGAKALAWLGDRFNVLKEDALSAYQGIADALAAGDISLAVKILWLTIKMEWTRGVNFLEKAWLNFRNFFIKIGYDAWHGLLAVAEIVWHALEVGWIETTAFFSKLWTDFTSFFSKTWENIKAGAQKAWNWIKSLFDDSVDLEAENKLVEEQKQA
ncbi:MAG: phage tail tape measure protein, partial [Planctomycetes bacterium]|nr:phage tail tape measure protein [Planctomycetota bacterium]